jgi:uncharacterized lipoprotein YajG
MNNLQNAIIEGALAQMLNDAIASINYDNELKKRIFIYK